MRVAVIDLERSRDLDYQLRVPLITAPYLTVLRPLTKIERSGRGGRKRAPKTEKG
jgi:hypothetical protein